MTTIYVIDRANQFHTFEFITRDEALDAADRWEASGHEVFYDYLQAALKHDKFVKFLREQAAKKYRKQ